MTLCCYLRGKISEEEFHNKRRRAQYEQNDEETGHENNFENKDEIEMAQRGRVETERPLALEHIPTNSEVWIQTDSQE